MITGIATKLVSVMVAAAGVVSSVVLADLQSGAPRAWIDFPFDGSSLKMGDVEVVAHAADQEGVAEAMFRVNGAVIQTLQGQGGSHKLHTLRFRWNATSPGKFLLEVRARNASTAWGPPAAATVTILGGPAPVQATSPPAPGTTPTPTPTATATLLAAPSSTPRPTASASSKPQPLPSKTATPTATPSQTPTPCSPPAPILTRPRQSELVDTNPPEFEWTYETLPCAPGGHRIIVATDRSLTQVVVSGDVGGTARSWRPNEQLPDCTTLYWRVASKRRDGSISAYSELRNFTMSLDC